MVEPFDGGANRQRPHVVFPRFLKLAGPQRNGENVGVQIQTAFAERPD